MTDTPATHELITGLGVSLRGVGKQFESGLRAIQSMDLEIGPGEFAAILGPSGCGKSTLLRIIAGLDKPTQGRVVIGSSEYPLTTASSPSPAPSSQPLAPISFVFQDPHLLPWRNVLGNVVLPLELTGRNLGQARDRSHEILRQVGLGDAEAMYPNQLSGGMRMRVSLARALVTHPELLLLDEPFAALDELTRQGLDEQLRQLWLDQRMTVLFVTHSIQEAAFLAQRAIVLTKRPARIVEDRKLDLPLERVAALRIEPVFAGQMKWMYEALVRGGGGG